MSAKDEAGEVPAGLGTDKPIRDFQDLLDLSLALIEAQRTRVARAMREETRDGGLDKALSVEIKRLNAMLATYNELLNTPQAKSAVQPRGGGAVSQILASIAPQSRNRSASRSNRPSIPAMAS